MKILCVHPSSELYGSDRSFAGAVGALSERHPEAKPVVLLPGHGPLETLPPFDRIAVSTRHMWILRRADLLCGLTVGLWSNLLALAAALRDMNASSLVYINTIIVFDFIFMARFVRRRPVIIHIREIPTGVEMKIFRLLLMWSKAAFIFNSEATRAAFDLPKSRHCAVIYNGYADPGGVSPSDWDGRRPLRILTIGRLNRWKGQETLIAAIGLLSREDRARVDVRIVGGTFNNLDVFRENLEQRIAELDVAGVVRIDPFETDPTGSYRWADVVVVPSRLPEPFGRVAIEAMAFARPVVASGHGGLVEIVRDGETGRLFDPASEEALAAALRELLADPALVRAQGEAGRRRFLSTFTIEATNRALGDAIDAAAGGAWPSRVMK